MSKTLIYQMLPRLWGKGRFGSVNDASLRYIKGLGITHLWCTGIIRHSTEADFVKGSPGSPYAIRDYYDVNPYLAYRKENRMSEFENLIKRVHEHGLKLVIDFVPNHIGRDYSDSHGGIPHHDFCDYDWTDTLKINYSDPSTWTALLSILRFWAGKGVDGFRCDMVEIVPPHFFTWAIAQIKKEYPNLIFIAEVYQKDKYRTYIREVGFDCLYDKSGLYDVIRAVEAGHSSARAITWNWQSLGDLQTHMLNFLENHDEQRIASSYFTGRSENQAALSVSLLFNQAPFMLYFGEEVGEDAAEGHEGRTSIFDICHVDKIQRLYESIVRTNGSIEKIIDDSQTSENCLNAEEKATLRSHMSLLNLSQENAFAEGMVYDLCYCQNRENGFDAEKHFAFLRKSMNETNKLQDITYLLTANFSDFDAEMSIIIPHEAKEYLHIAGIMSYKENGVTHPVTDTGIHIRIPAHQMRIIEMECEGRPF